MTPPNITKRGISTGHGEPEIGDKMPDGTVLAGISPDTNKPMYAASADASLRMTFNDAQQYFAQLNAHGHKDWRIPTKAELNVLFENREKGALKGTFNSTASDDASYYWSAALGKGSRAWIQQFSDGHHYYDNFEWYGKCSVRCVR
jgi:hypothetical protein